MAPTQKRVVFILFFLLGFCGLIYETVWLRQAELAFGAITPVVSAVVSFFMFGIALGSWLGGAWSAALQRRRKISPLAVFVFCEIIIGLAAYAVPAVFHVGQRLLLRAGPIDSLLYLSGSMLVLGVAIIPGTFFMGALFPIIAAYAEDRKSFGRVYLANVFGGMCGAFWTNYILIELNGLRGALFVGLRLNLVAALVALLLARTERFFKVERRAPGADFVRRVSHAGVVRANENIPVWVILFAMGLGLTAMQTIWVRLYSSVIGPTVYGYAHLLVLALFGTWLGSWRYLRRDYVSKPVRVRLMSSLLFYCSLLPALLHDTRLDLGFYGLFLGMFPVCAAIGYLTPYLVEYHARGKADRLGHAYGATILGSIFGPLVAVYLLLPAMSERVAVIVLSLPFYFICHVYYERSVWRRLLGAATLCAALAVVWGHQDFVVENGVVSDPENGSQVWRGHSATVIASGPLPKGPGRLFVNSEPVARMSVVSKFMVHLPFLLHDGPVKSALLIGFGTGTAFRSALSWGTKTTVVETIRGVTEAFGFFHEDAGFVVANSNGKIVIDDGRRYLMRTSERYDVIVVNPQPPLEGAAAGMLYAREFYDLAKKHLDTGGILHQWYPVSEYRSLQAVVRSLLDSFPYVVGYRTINKSGCHFICSMTPIGARAEKAKALMPDEAKVDMKEWNPNATFEQVYQMMFAFKQRPTALVSEHEQVVITDDNPYNEYFQVRRNSENDGF